jgi:hypothetical protein
MGSKGNLLTVNEPIRSLQLGRNSAKSGKSRDYLVTTFLSLKQKDVLCKKVAWNVLIFGAVLFTLL